MALGFEPTDAQKAALESQVAYAEALTRIAVQKKGCIGKISAFLAHPAVVTAIGSGLLAALVLVFQGRLAAAQHEVEQSRQLRERRVAIAAVSIADFDRSGMVLTNLQKLKNAIDSGNYPDHLTREEAFTIYKSLITTYMSMPHRFSTVAQLDSWYSCDSEVVARVSKVDQIYKTFEELKPEVVSRQQLNDFEDGAERSLGDLSKAIVAAVGPNGKCY